MRLERWESPLYFWYSTFCHNTSIRVPDLNFLTDAHSQGRINVDPEFSVWRCLLLHGSVTTHCNAYGVYVPIHDLSTYHQILLSIKFSIKILSKICPLWQISFPFILWELLAQRLGDLLFDQVIQVLLLVSWILAQSTKIWWHCIIAFCIAPYHVHHFIIIKSQVCL
jgi:hypothetical protein